MQTIKNPFWTPVDNHKMVYGSGRTMDCYNRNYSEDKFDEFSRREVINILFSLAGEKVDKIHIKENINELPTGDAYFAGHSYLTDGKIETKVIDKGDDTFLVVFKGGLRFEWNTELVNERRRSCQKSFTVLGFMYTKKNNSLNMKFRLLDSGYEWSEHGGKNFMETYTEAIEEIKALCNPT